MKNARQDAMLSIIRRREVTTQEELKKYLEESGHSTTQATISRDIRKLGISKSSSEGGRARYICPEAASEGENGLKETYSRVFRDSVTSIEAAENLLVIKTVSGMAMAAAAALDDMKCSEILGSIAGDDTILCASRTAEDAAGLARRLEKLL